MGIEMDKPPRDMSLNELSDRCKGEINRYMNEESHNDDYCLEIFRRATVQKDPDAWELLMQRFSGIVVGWVRRHPNRELAYRLDSEKSYVDLTFERLWKRTIGNEPLEFSSLAGALAFLRHCVNCAIIDTLRGYLRPSEVPLPEPGIGEEPFAHDASDDASETWEAIKSLLPNEREQRAAYLLYHCNLKPREIVRRCPEEFSNVQEIYRIIRNIRDRLERNKDRLRWLLGDEG